MAYEQQWMPFFPFPAPRKEQHDAIEKAIDAIYKGKRFIICDMPTGVGKSPLAVTLALWAAHHLPSHQGIQGKKSPNYFAPGATILTTQKILQDQYMRDFERMGMKTVKAEIGRAHV